MGPLLSHVYSSLWKMEVTDDQQRSAEEPRNAAWYSQQTNEVLQGLCDGKFVSEFWIIFVVTTVYFVKWMFGFNVKKNGTFLGHN